MVSGKANNPPTVLQQLQAAKNIPVELKQIFQEEAEEQLLYIYESLDSLKQSPRNKEAVSQVRRSAHTLKGAAGAVGMEAITRLSHRMEDLLDHVAEQPRGINSDHRHLLLETADLLQDLTAHDVGDMEAISARLQNTYTRYEMQLGSATGAIATPSAAASWKVSESPRESQQDEQFLRVPLKRLDQLVGTIGEMIVNRSVMNQRLADVHARIASTFSILERMQLASFELQSNHNLEAADFLNDELAGPLGENSLASTELGTLDQDSDFYLLAQMLNEGCNDVEFITREMRKLKMELESLLRRQDRFNREAQTSLLRIRMVPLSNVVSKLQRTVRAVSSKLDKRIELVVKGDHTELDKTVMDQMIAPLQHLIRNAMDHGIESPTERERLGKPLESQLHLEALYQGTQVTLKLSDDGRGINFDRLREKAIESGKIGLHDATTYEEKCRLLFLPGITTAANLTDVSGRGVGLDIVREAVVRLNGNIRVQSEINRGTTFTIQLPISVGVTQVLMVETADRKFAIPRQAIGKITRLDVSAVIRSGQKSLVQVDNQMMELRDLANHLELPSRLYTNPDEAPLILIIQAGADQIAVIVESIEGCEEVVVKSLGSHLRQIPGLMGATIEGDGTVVPILDPMDIVGRDSGDITEVADATRQGNPLRVPTAMVIDDSISVRRATTHLLQTAGWDIVTAKNGVDALEKLDEMETPPDIFLCDMEMPRMDGIELVKRLRKQPEFQSTPFVMITSRSADSHSALAFDAGVSNYLVKPYHDEQLLKLVNELVQIAWETVDA